MLSVPSAPSKSPELGLVLGTVTQLVPEAGTARMTLIHGQMVKAVFEKERPKDGG